MDKSKNTSNKDSKIISNSKKVNNNVSQYNTHRGKSTTKKNETKKNPVKDTNSDNKMKVQTRIISKKEEKKSFTERIEDKFNIEINITWISILKVSIITVLLIAGIVFGFYTTRITDIEVQTGLHYTEDEIKDFVIKDFFDKNSLILYFKYRYAEQEEIPFVEYVDIELLNKNKVKIIVYDKNIIGCTEYMNEYIYFDKDGYFVESSNEIMDNTPYVTGINFKDIILYKKMSVDNDKLFETIIGLTQQIKKYNLQINEINFDEEYNVTLYTDDISILLGLKETYDEQLAQLPNILEQAKKNKMKGILHLENYKEGVETFNFDKTE